LAWVFKTKEKKKEKQQQQKKNHKRVLQRWALVYLW